VHTRVRIPSLVAERGRGGGGVGLRGLFLTVLILIRDLMRRLALRPRRPGRLGCLRNDDDRRARESNERRQTTDERREKTDEHQGKTTVTYLRVHWGGLFLLWSLFLLGLHGHLRLGTVVHRREVNSNFRKAQSPQPPR